MGLDDSHVNQIADYLTENCNLRSITLDGNRGITNVSFIKLASTLVKNSKLSHMSFKDCNYITSEGLS